MAQVIPLRSYTFRLDNCLIDDYAAAMGAIGVAIYTVLQRYADRTTGQCWPSVPTMAATLNLSPRCVQKYLRHLARIGLIDIASRRAADGDPTSNLYTLHDPTQTEALRRRQRGRASDTGGGAASAPPPTPTSHGVQEGGAPRADEQDPSEQEILTSVAEGKTAAPACTHPGHEHCSPVSGLVLCLDCFRAWETPLADVASRS